MTIWVKICGLSTESAVDAAVEAGANAVGFVFHSASPRNVTPEKARQLAQRVPAGIQTVAVTRHPSSAQVEAVLKIFKPTLWQSDAADFAEWVMPPWLEILPVLRSGLLPATPLPSRCLYESAASGQGVRADWEEATRLARQCQLILAGGLDPDSVAEAVARVRPFGVDVSSGVESAAGVKDLGKIRAFIEAARAA
jgi:phosphoribosylanthranilate isomerase